MDDKKNIAAKSIWCILIPMPKNRQRDFLSPVLSLNQEHRFEEALVQIEKDTELLSTDYDMVCPRRGRSPAHAEVYVRATRSTREDIERGLAITQEHPDDEFFLVWRETFLAQQMTHMKLAGQPGAQEVGLERLQIIDKLTGMATDETDRDRWVCKRETFSIPELREPCGWKYEWEDRMLRRVREIQETKTSQDLTALADWAIAVQDRELATELLAGAPYKCATDGKREDWKKEQPNLTPYNRRGFGLEILVTGKTPAKKIRQKFATSQALGCMNELRSVALMLLELPANGAKKLGEEFKRELAY